VNTKLLKIGGLVSGIGLFCVIFFIVLINTIGHSYDLLEILAWISILGFITGIITLIVGLFKAPEPRKKKNIKKAEDLNQPKEVPLIKMKDHMFCKNCGKQILDTSKFCEYCGGKV
jgi:hypothetical protein